MHEMERPVKRVDGPSVITIVLQHGPLHGEQIEDAPWDAVWMCRALDDGTVVEYTRWDDNVWRYDSGTVD